MTHQRESAVELRPATLQGGQVAPAPDPRTHENWIRTVMFLGAYSPLFAMLALRFSGNSLRWGCAVVSLAGILLLGLHVGLLPRRVESDIIEVAEVRDQGSEVAGFLATYLLPFLTVAEPTVNDLLAYAAFLLVSFVIYVRSEMIQVNPTLYVLGYRVHYIRDTSGWSGYVISKNYLRVGDHVRKVNVSTEVLVEMRGLDETGTKQ